MPANPWAGEVELVVDGVSVKMKLTLGVLASLEAELGEDSLVDLVGRFETGSCKTSDLIHLLAAGLNGGGWEGSVEDVMTADIKGGVVAGLRAAGRLLAVTFADIET